MNQELLWVLMAVCGYLLGAIPFGIVVSKALGLPDSATAIITASVCAINRMPRIPPAPALPSRPGAPTPRKRKPQK